MKQFKDIVTQVLATAGAFYILLFLIWHLDTTNNVPDLDFVSNLFSSIIFVLPLFFITMLALIRLGKVLAEESLFIAKNKALMDINRQEQRLLDYIKLAKIITKDDAETITRNYLDKLTKDFT